MLLLCNYYVTYRCNAYCEFCHFGDHTNFKDNPYASLEDFKKNVNQLAELGVKFIDLTGGEPVLHKEIFAMAKFVPYLTDKTRINTKGLMLHQNIEKKTGKNNSI